MSTYAVPVQSLTGQGVVYCASLEEVEMVRSREMRMLEQHHSQEFIIEHSLALVTDLSVSEREEREAKIESHGDRSEYEFREAADSLWERAPARMSLEIERCKLEAQNLGIEFKEPSDLTVEKVREAKAYIESVKVNLEELAELAELTEVENATVRL